MYRVILSKQTIKDKSFLKAAGLEQKARDLLNIIRENPFQNPPPYEKLVGNLRRYYFRRINVRHRLVYEVFDNAEQNKDHAGILYKGIVIVARMWTHYE